MDTIKKALLVGINQYPDPNILSGCVDDAKSIADLLESNYDNGRNFDIKMLLDNQATSENIHEGIASVFCDENVDTGLFYFSGHGYDDKKDGCLICLDEAGSEIEKIQFSEIMDVIRKSKCKSKVVILDCCFAGKLGNTNPIGDETLLEKNTVIFTSCSDSQTSLECNGRGVFSTLLQDGLNGGAADVLGDVTPGSLYAYIDKALNSWEQRPFFKANVSSFISLRTCKPRVTKQEMYDCMALFDSYDSSFPLDPSFEFTNTRSFNRKAIRPFAKEENVNKLKLLQKMNRNGIVDPKDADHMYFAAMNSKSCVLTPLGRHYWRLCKEKKI